MCEVLCGQPAVLQNLDDHRPPLQLGIKQRKQRVTNDADRPCAFITLHVVTKKLQSIRDDALLEQFLFEINV